MLFLSLWHGLWPGYYISFLYEMMYIMVERTVSGVAIIAYPVCCITAEADEVISMLCKVMDI